MAFAVASQPGSARLAEDDITSAAAAATSISQHCLSDGPLGRVGLEIEQQPVLHAAYVKLD